MNDRIPEDKPTRVPAGANRWWNQPRAIDLEGTERLRAIRGACAKSARLLEREPTDWKAGCGRSARPVWREGWSQNSTPTPIDWARLILACSMVSLLRFIDIRHPGLPFLIFRIQK